MKNVQRLYDWEYSFVIIFRRKKGYSESYILDSEDKMNLKGETS